MKILMGTFISLKHVLVFSSLPTGWEASSFNEERWLNECGMHGKAIQELHHQG
jgi:hypothetical protein